MPLSNFTLERSWAERANPDITKQIKSRSWMQAGREREREREKGKEGVLRMLMESTELWGESSGGLLLSTGLSSFPCWRGT